jgi:16S rRNA (guanine966-N2)-methyltransferase
MRIISGYYKGRKLLSPPAIRPTQDMVRKSMFDILGDIEGLAFLELFAGSGAVGFEALSRGAKPVVFVEQDRQALKAITLNQESLKAQENSLIIAKDVLQTVPFLHKQGKKFDIVFLDPPYCKVTGGKRNEASASGPGEKVSDSLAKKTLQLLERQPP